MTVTLNTSINAEFLNVQHSGYIYRIGTGPFSKVKGPVRGVGHSPTSSAGVKETVEYSASGV
jgi:hypothetical protein